MSPIHIAIAAEPVAAIGSFIVTNSILTSLIASLAIGATFIFLARRVAVHPAGGLSHALEALIEAVEGFVGETVGQADTARTLFPFVMTLFIFILVNNWLGLLPGVGSIVLRHGGESVPLLRGASADLNTTIALAVISVLVTHAYAIYRLGLFRHLKKYVSLNPMMMFVGFLEFISEVSKLLSFSFRLFGNIFAGEVLLVVIAAFMPLLAPLPFLVMEIFFGFIQALVFAVLTLVFMQIALTDHDADHQQHASGQAAVVNP
jgi:F-type H+-transporting ATPase subunit a